MIYKRTSTQKQEKPLVYLATPYSHENSGVRDYRFKSVNKVASDLMLRGLHIFSPISHTHPIALAGMLPLGWEFWEAFDRAYLSHCHKVIVLMLDGWEISKGVSAEIRIAQEMGLVIEYLTPEEFGIEPYSAEYA